MVQIHDWSLTAAIANECVYKLKPEAFAPYRTLIFQSQSTTNAANVRDNLLAYADQVGVDRSSLAGCLDSKASMRRIDEGTSEAKQLEVQSTPTCFINGRMLVGFVSPDAYYKAVDAGLEEGKKGTRSRSAVSGRWPHHSTLRSLFRTHWPARCPDLEPRRLSGL